MRQKIGEHGIGGRDESWFYVEYDEAADDFFHVHEWHNMNHRLSASEGEEKTSIVQARGLPFYQAAVDWIRQVMPAWRNLEQL